MARKVGQVNEATGRVESRTVHRITEVEWPVTRVMTRRQRLARSLWG
ncbi:hypothetical protein AB0F81_29745 [Actinoplanes sp. NPDC024001]